MEKVNFEATQAYDFSTQHLKRTYYQRAGIIFIDLKIRSSYSVSRWGTPNIIGKKFQFTSTGATYKYKNKEDTLLTGAVSLYAGRETADIRRQ